MDTNSVSDSDSMHAVQYHPQTPTLNSTWSESEAIMLADYSKYYQSMSTFVEELASSGNRQLKIPKKPKGELCFNNIILYYVIIYVFVAVLDCFSLFQVD